MRKYSLFLFFWSLTLGTFGQVVSDSLSYAGRLQSAIEAAAEVEEDSVAYRNVFALFEDLYADYPDSMSIRGYYEAGLLACKLREADRAFHYLDPLVDTESSYGPGFIFIIGEYQDEAFGVLASDPRWKTLVEKARKNKTDFYRSLKAQRTEFFMRASEGKSAAIFAGSARLKGEALYKALQVAKDYLPKQQRNYSISFTVSDTLASSYFVRLPKEYNPAKAYPLLICLHGAVRYTALEDFVADWIMEGHNRFYVSEAEKAGVILVFPLADKQFNWMYPDDGFYMVPAILKEVKQALHVDDDRVFVCGHSNGATGAFSYWMKQPSPFAGCFGLNTYPKVWEAGTYLLNGKNRFFVNFSTDQDYYYPPQANDRLDTLTRQLGLDYSDHRYEGYPHWFPQFDASEAAFRIIFEEMGKRRRNPFPCEIYRETDDVKYGQTDWLEIAELDTLSSRASWHKTYNFPITTRLAYNDKEELVSEQVNKKAFDFPRASGAVKAEYAKNVFRVQTSCVDVFRLYISPEMVDMNKKVKVYVNGKLKFKRKVKWDDAFLRQTFRCYYDRRQLWVNCIEIKV